MKKNILIALYLVCFATYGQVYVNSETTYLNAMGYATVNFNVNDGGDFQVTENGDLDIDGDVSIHANGKLQMFSVSDLFSNLWIDNGRTVSGNATYHRFTNVFGTGDPDTAGNDLVSSPFPGQTFGTFQTANPGDVPTGNFQGTPSWLFGPFNGNIMEVPGAGGDDPYTLWPTAATTNTIDRGIGYRTAHVSGGTLEFSGTIENTDFTIPIQVFSVYPWNLVGNPYSTYLNVQDFIAANAAIMDEDAVGVYGYDGTAAAGAGDWTVLNNNNSNTNTNIAPGQGFMILPEGAGNIQFSHSMRRMGDSDDFIAVRSFENKHFRLHLQGNNDQFISDFYFNNNSTRSLDPGYDAKLFYGSQNGFHMYSHLVDDNVGTPFVMQSLPSTDYEADVLIPIGVVAQSGDELTFSISESTLPAGSNVYLFDNETNNVTDISSNNYTVQLTSDLNGTGRFYINFNNTTLGLDENQLFNNLNMYVEQDINHLVISGQLNEKVDVSIFDMHGRQVLETNLSLTSNIASKIDLSNLSSGFYVAKVQLKGNNQILKTKKFILN